MNTLKKGLLSFSTALLLFPVFAPFGARTAEVKANFEGYKSNCLTSADSDPTKSDTGADIGGVGGDWTKKGTATNKNAQIIFDDLTKTVGFSGAGASGALAIAKRESMFDPKAINPGGGVAGWFQWSGFSHNLNGSRITAEGSIKPGDTSTLTPENEIKLLNFELNGNWKKAKTVVGNATDPKQASLDWSQYYEGVSLSDGQTKAGQLVQDAQTAYQAFGGANISANSALLGGTAGANAGEQKSQDSNKCQSTDSNDDGIVGVAKSLLGYFTYGLAHGESLIGSVDSPNRSGITDCSGFVWLVLAKAGYNVPKNMAWFTQTMEDDSKGKHQYLTQIDENQAGAGDVVIVNTGDGSGANGHTAILEEKWKGDKTKIIQMGGIPGAGGVNESTFKDSFLSLLSDGKPVFARPVKK